MKTKTLPRAVAYSLSIHGLVLAMLFILNINTTAPRQTIENVPFIKASLVYAMNGRSDQKTPLPLPRKRNHTAPIVNKPVEPLSVIDEARKKTAQKETVTYGTVVKQAQSAAAPVLLHLPSVGGAGVGQFASLGAASDNDLPDGWQGGSGQTQTGQMILPRYLNATRPVYPVIARTRGYEGIVLLAVEVMMDGRAGEIRIKKSSGYPLLDQAALNAVRAWRFEPARKRNMPLAMTVDIPIRFSLKEAD